VARNLSLAALAITGLLAGTPASAHPAGVALAMFAGALAATALIRVDEIVDLFVTDPPGPPRAPGLTAETRETACRT